MHRRRQPREQELRAGIAHDQFLLHTVHLPHRQPRLLIRLLLLLVHHLEHRRQLIEFQGAHQDRLILELVSARRNVLARVRLHVHPKLVRLVHVLRRVDVEVVVGLADREADVVALGQQNHRLHALHVRVHRDQPILQAHLLELQAPCSTFTFTGILRQHVGVADELDQAVLDAPKDAVTSAAFEFHLRHRPDPLLQNLRLLRCALRALEKRHQLRLDMLRDRLAVVHFTRILVVFRRDQIFHARATGVGVNVRLRNLHSIFPCRTGWRVRRSLVVVESG